MYIQLIEVHNMQCMRPNTMGSSWITLAILPCQFSAIMALEAEIININLSELAGVRIPQSVLKTTPYDHLFKILLPPGKHGRQCWSHWNIDDIVKHLFGQLPEKNELPCCFLVPSPSPIMKAFTSTTKQMKVN
jgi:hypothetical protein